MIIKEIIDMTKEKPIAIIARDHLEIGEKKLREILKDIGGHHQKGQRGWTFEGNPEDLERSIYDFVQDGRKVKANNKQNQETNKEENKPTNKEENKKIKKVTYEINEYLHDQLKIRSIREKRKISDVVNDIIKEALKDDRI